MGFGHPLDVLMEHNNRSTLETGVSCELCFFFVYFFERSALLLVFVGFYFTNCTWFEIELGNYAPDPVMQPASTHIGYSIVVAA